MEGCGVVQLQLVAWLKLSGSLRRAMVEVLAQRNRDAFGAISRGLKVIGFEGPLPFILREGKGKGSNKGRCSFLVGHRCQAPGERLSSSLRLKLLFTKRNGMNSFLWSTLRLRNVRS